MKVYLLTATEFLQTSVLGVFSERKDAEEQKSRLEKISKSPHVFCMTKYEIYEVPFNSTEVIDEGIEQLKKELGLE